MVTGFQIPTSNQRKHVSLSNYRFLQKLWTPLQIHRYCNLYPTNYWLVGG